jgi:aryl-alcohol dehydrogenase-like predicted oxidoreductase
MSPLNDFFRSRIDQMIDLRHSLAVLASRMPWQEMAAIKGCTPGQLVLAWLLAQGDDVVAIPGTKKNERMTENFMASHIKLTPSEVSDLIELFPSHVAAGARYSAGGMKGVFL